MANRADIAYTVVSSCTQHSYSIDSLYNPVSDEKYLWKYGDGTSKIKPGHIEGSGVLVDRTSRKSSISTTMYNLQLCRKKWPVGVAQRPHTLTVSAGAVVTPLIEGTIFRQCESFADSQIDVFWPRKQNGK